ncbi:MAG: TolC family protein [Deltaproteobacteria bacterium]|nr:TolC family protein [Deltaproteobacteria bacterium]
MRTDPRAPRARWSLVCALLMGQSACFAHRMDSDIHRLREVTRTAAIPTLESAEIPVETLANVRATLAHPMSDEDIVRVALSNNRALRGQLRELGVFHGRMVQDALPSNPSVNFDLRRSTDPTQFLQGDVSLEFDVMHSLLAPMRAGPARSELDAARHRVANDVIALGLRVRAAVYALQAAQAQLVIATRTLDTFAAARDAARAYLAAGNSYTLELANHEATYQTARVTVAELELSVADHREALQRLLGVHGEETQWTLANLLAEVPPTLDPFDGFEQQVITRSLAMAEARSTLESHARRAGYERTRGAIPDVSLDVHAEQDGNFWELGGGARVTLPIFDRRQGAAMASESAFDGALERYVGLAVDLRSESRQALNHLRSAHARYLQFSTQILPARRAVLEQTMLQYNAMQIGVYTLLAARRDELDAQLRALDARREFWTAQATVDAMLAGHRAMMDTSSRARPGMAVTRSDNGGH